MAEIEYSVSDNIATITLNRPERMNAISRSMLAELSAALVAADEDKDVRVVVLTGAGRSFCVGLDLQEASRGEGIGGSQGNYAPTLDLRNAPPIVLNSIDKPTICALNGSAAGYGMDLALGCDIRIMSQDAKLAAAFVKRGVVPESGGTWFLPRMLGWAKAAEIIFTGRTLSATECLADGLANQLVAADDVMSTAMALTREIASNAPLAVSASKRMMRMGLEETFPTHVQHVYLQLLPLFASADFREGIASFLEKREAKFKGQ